MPITKDRNQGYAFIRDNTNGGLVRKAVCRMDGSIRYEMVEGHSYLLKEPDFELMGRLGFEPRFEKTPHNEE